MPEVGGAGGSKGSSNVKGSIEVEYKPKKEKISHWMNITVKQRRLDQ